MSYMATFNICCVDGGMASKHTYLKLVLSPLEREPTKQSHTHDLLNDIFMFTVSKFQLNMNTTTIAIMMHTCLISDWLLTLKQVK